MDRRQEGENEEYSSMGLHLAQEWGLAVGERRTVKLVFQRKAGAGLI